VTVVPETRPPSTPAKAKIFAKPAELFPEPQRNLIAAVAMDVYVEGLSDQMGGSERTGRPNSNESCLFRARANRRRDLKRKTGIAHDIYQPERRILDIRR